MTFAADGAPSWRVVILTSGWLGTETASRLQQAGANVVAVINAPASRRRPAIDRLVRKARREGVAGLLASAWRRLTGAGAPAPAALPLPASVARLDFSDLHGEDLLAALGNLEPDVIILDGSGIVSGQHIRAARRACLNIHCGALPAYRGAPPVFWELYHAEPSVGVTIHLVEEMLDSGPIVSERTLPLESAPAGDPEAYCVRVWREQLRPAAQDMLARVLSDLPAALGAARPQPATTSKPNRAPDRDTRQAMHARVAARRRGDAPGRQSA